MTTHLTADQRAQIQSALQARQRELGARLAAQQDGRSRAEHAREVLLQDGDDAPQRDADREVDLALTDMESLELAQIGRALERLRAPGFGVCDDCGAGIPFARLRLEPHALRCVACESRREKATGGAPRPTL